MTKNKVWAKVSLKSRALYLAELTGHLIVPYVGIEPTTTRFHGENRRDVTTDRPINLSDI